MDDNPKSKSKKNLTFAELGRIMLDQVGEEKIRKGYNITDPENELDGVGRAAIQWRDINPDGTLN
jgi:hypothetical protein